MNESERDGKRIKLDAHQPLSYINRIEIGSICLNEFECKMKLVCTTLAPTARPATAVSVCEGNTPDLCLFVFMFCILWYGVGNSILKFIFALI